MAVNGVSYVSEALSYINGLPVVQSSKSIVGDTVDAVKQAPSFTIFEMAPKVYGGLKYGLNSTGATGLSGAWQSLKDMGGLVDDTIQLQKGLSGASMNYDALSAIYKAKGALGVSGSEAAGLADEAIALAKEGLAQGSKETIAQAGVKANEAVSVAKVAAKEANPGLFSKLKGLLKIGAKGGADDLTNAVSGAASGAAGEAAGAAAGATAEVAAKGATGLLGKTGAVLKKSGAGVMMAIEGAMELFTNVIPAFQAGGVKSGAKQLGKSTVKVAASTGGFVAGSAAGKAIGAAIGSVFPGAGTVIGGMIGGFVGGLVGSSLAKGAAEKITGKSEVEKLQEEAIDEQAAMIAGDSASMSQLNQALQLAIQQDMADGELSEDGQKMLEYLNSGAFNTTNSTGYNTTTYSGSGLDQLVAQIQSGDRSAYNVPTSVLEASANAISGTGYANNYTTFGMTNPYASTSTTTGNNEEVFNYFS